MSGPAPIWRERKMRLWQEPAQLIMRQGEPLVKWGRRHIPVEQLTSVGKIALGIYVPVEMPRVRQTAEVEEALK